MSSIKCSKILSSIVIKSLINNSSFDHSSKYSKFTLDKQQTAVLSSLVANVISELCEKVPSGDVDTVTEAIGSDSRIGSKYLKGGLGFGGTCFPRDNVALSFICKELNSSHGLLDITDEYNDTLSARFIQKILPYVKKGETAAVLGLAYKPLSHIVEESQSILLAKALSDAGLRVIGYDPLAADEARPVLQYHTLVEDSLENALKDATIVFVANNDEVFKKLTPQQLVLDKEEVRVVDFWRCLSSDFCNHPRIKYIPIGKCLDSDFNTEKFNKLWSNAL